MAPYIEKLLSKPRPFLRKTKIDAILVPTYVIPSKRTVPKEKTKMGTLPNYSPPKGPLP